MTPPPPPTTSAIPTMRVAVELVFVRSCAECRAVAERTAVSAIGDASVTVFRAIPGNRHAHHMPEDLPPQTDRLFEPIPQSDTNGFDPQGRAE